jgi:hypothetical protein
MAIYFMALRTGLHSGMKPCRSDELSCPVTWEGLLLYALILELLPN